MANMQSDNIQYQISSKPFKNNISLTDKTGINSKYSEASWWCII